ncbi:hypothetical protein M441DRAFT_225444 [Trichoderma asperellum CBS 433.97]|uniref:Secreted protein n=1 Tax=Trichoderma asperellum (strain ATCC 204424 / CBS 433.97 / NBRC 101777) TaxID=1042311 RepID=A0A2T3ZPV8_TRIA4|nr:hypothetical protein M441DRAFT_225444 [Trichoderma asperellum CBS 433.97]PTB46837.1 hypothetical protein M441DRAFT_225444 [Trichoderma asperellum CBS 433.97]
MACVLHLLVSMASYMIGFMPAETKPAPSTPLLMGATSVVGSRSPTHCRICWNFPYLRMSSSGNARHVEVWAGRLFCCGKNEPSFAALNGNTSTVSLTTPGRTRQTQRRFPPSLQQAKSPCVACHRPTARAKRDSQWAATWQLRFWDGSVSFSCRRSWSTRHCRRALFPLHFRQPQACHLLQPRVA